MTTAIVTVVVTSSIVAACKAIAEKVGFKFWKPFIWDKMKIGMVYHYRSRYENILIFEKGIAFLKATDIKNI
ncbi:MAG: hypothetical protein AB7I18_09340 [Candidatus Berkiella sp.]